MKANLLVIMIHLSIIAIGYNVWEMFKPESHKPVTPKVEKRYRWNKDNMKWWFDTRHDGPVRTGPEYHEGIEAPWI